MLVAVGKKVISSVNENGISREGLDPMDRFEDVISILTDSKKKVSCFPIPFPIPLLHSYLYRLKWSI